MRCGCGAVAFIFSIYLKPVLYTVDLEEIPSVRKRISYFVINKIRNLILKIKGDLKQLTLSIEMKFYLHLISDINWYISKTNFRNLLRQKILSESAMFQCPCVGTIYLYVSIMIYFLIRFAQTQINDLYS